VYSLGVVLFEMLTGDTPYRGAFRVIVGQILAAPVPPVKEFRADVDARLDAICRKAMTKEPAARFASMAEFANALGQYLKAPKSSPPSLPVRQAPSPVVDRAPFGDLVEATASNPAAKKAKTRRAVAIALALALLVSLCGWLAVVMLRVETANGTLIVEMNDNDVEARIKNGKLILSGPDGKVRYTLTPQDRSKKLEAGPYKIRVEGADGLVLDTTEFTLQKGGEVKVRVTMAPKAVVKDTPVGLDPNREPDDKGFVPLFNGKDLTGWKTHPDDKAKWVVRDGILIGSGQLGHLFSERGDYENFHFRIEAMINDHGNSGQYFRTEFGPRFPKGYEAQINSTARDSIKTGSLYNIVNVTDQLHKPDEWFTQEVIAEGDHIVIKVNGKTVVDTHDSRYKKGHFALQQHDPATVVKFRKIEVKSLEPRASLDPDHKAAKWVLSCGGTVRVSVLGEEKAISPAETLPAEKFEVLEINLNGKQVGEDGLAHLDGLTYLRRLDLADATQVTDAGLVHVKGLTSLAVLNLMHTGVSDATLTHLKGLKNLRELYLFWDQVTDGGLAILKDLTNLENLDLNATQVTDAGLIHLKGLTKLKWLNLMQTQVTGAGFVHIKDLANLQVLYLMGSKVGDIGMGHLKGMLGLRNLGLQQTRVSDAGLEHLVDLKNLAQLNLKGTAVSDKGVAKLKAALPRCDITR
jgi:hypothetical protein